jgi:dynein heavy chain
MTRYIPPLIEYITEGLLLGVLGVPLRQILPVNPLSLVVQLGDLLDAAFQNAQSPSKEALEAIFIQAIVWSLGAPLLSDDRAKFSDAVKKLSELSMVNVSGPVSSGQIPGNDRLLYDYYYDAGKSQWTPWEELVPTYIHKPTVSFHEILVPTVDTVRHTWVLQQFHSIKRPILFVGDVGTSKTVTMQTFLRNLPSDANILLNINFSSRTTSMDVQKIVEGNIEKRTKDVFGPPGGKRLLIFVDDLNMPGKDKYGTQQPVALLKLLIEKNGLYDRGKELNWKNIRDIGFISAMGPPGGGRNDVDPRFIGLFSVTNICFPKEASLHRIYSSLLAGHLAIFSSEIFDLASPLTSMSLKVSLLCYLRLGLF